MAPDDSKSTNGQATTASRFPDTQNIMSFFLSLLDRIASPATRQRAYDAVFRFCYQRPVLSSFLSVQLLFAMLPMLCFLGFSVCAVLMAAAVTVGAGVFCVGVAAVILFWALVITFTLAASTWMYLACCFVCIRWIARVSGYLEPSATKSQTTASGAGSSTGNPHQQSSTTKFEKPKKSPYEGNEWSDREYPKVEMRLDGDIKAPVAKA
ncbi:hypothetical protein ABW21_db0201428 [Orbilia brochopaga]|nr:hypothetical protein ABW21_db0201428 [Drechslerella brochopaga]